MKQTQKMISTNLEYGIDNLNDKVKMKLIKSELYL